MAPSAFSRAVEALERAHRLALILLVGPNDRANEAREQFDKLLPPHLHACSYRIDRQGPDIMSFVESLADPFPILFVHGFERLPPEQREDVEIRLNLLRDAFAQHHLGLVFWLPRDTLESFLQHCPDLFAWRSLLAEVDDTELPISPLLSMRRNYLSRFQREIRLPRVLIETRVQSDDQSSLPISFQEWAMQTRLGVVVGSPASGKTTALQILAHQLAGHAYSDATQPVPILLPGREFSAASQFSTSEPWTCSVHLGLPSDVLSMLARSGQLVILLDGLDEAPAAVQRPLLDWIIALSSRYPRMKIIIATRPLGSSLLAGLSPDWGVVHMQGLTHAQIDELIDGYLAHDGVKLSEEDRQRIRAILDISFELHHPLFIRTLVTQYLKVGRLPLGDQRRPALVRAQLLSQLVDLQMTDFDEVRLVFKGIGRTQRADLLSDRDARRALQAMALAATVAGTSRIPREWMLSLFPGVPDLFSSRAVRENAEQLLISRTGFVHAVPTGIAFTHLRFQEYLAAEGLVDLDPDKVLEVLSTHVADTRWHDVVIDVVALMELRYSAGVKLLDDLAARALGISDANQRAVAFATLLAAALGVGVWSVRLASLLQAARFLIEDTGDAGYALEPVVHQAMHEHGKIGDPVTRARGPGSA